MDTWTNRHLDIWTEARELHNYIDFLIKYLMILQQCVYVMNDDAVLGYLVISSAKEVFISMCLLVSRITQKLLH